MVWFQCEDCGENLKKPKLPNHFWRCSATKLSCIDCGEIFGQHNVLGHNQCITEAEKYGPKVSNGTPAKPMQDSKSKQQPDFDINVGLSDRPPWFCSLCNTKATSKQTLLLHADGKKHRAKAKAIHAKQQQEQSAGDGTENGSNDEQKKEDLAVSIDASSDDVKGDSQNKKRKLEAINGAANGEVIQAKEEEEGKLSCAKKSKKKIDEEKINWKKLITSALKSKPEKALKIKKLKKLVMKSMEDSGIKLDESEIDEKIAHKVNSSSKFTVNGKYVKLAAKD